MITLFASVFDNLPFGAEQDVPLKLLHIRIGCQDRPTYRISVLDHYFYVVTIHLHLIPSHPFLTYLELSLS